MSKFTRKPLLQGLLLLALSIGIGFSSQAQAQMNGLQSGEGVFEVLASEIALQRGEAGLAYNTYLEMARQYKDPRLAQRAMEIAIGGGSPDLALQAAKTWDELSPASDTKPKEVLITLLILSNRWSDAVKPAIGLLKQQTPAQQENTLLQLQALLAKSKDESTALQAFYEITSTVKVSPKDPGLLYTYAMAAEKVGRIDVMEKTLREILRKYPNDANSLNALGYSLADRNIKLAKHISYRQKIVSSWIAWVG
jgi:tetratricopeptide (TPR) repeat protein